MSILKSPSFAHLEILNPYDLFKIQNKDFFYKLQQEEVVVNSVCCDNLPLNFVT